jgi:hypothetical protein
VLILPGRLTGAAKQMQEEEAIEEVAAPQVMLLGRKTLLPLLERFLGSFFFVRTNSICVSHLRLCRI